MEADLTHHWEDVQNGQDIEHSFQVAAVMKRCSHSGRAVLLRGRCENVPTQRLDDEHCPRQEPARDGGLGIQALESPKVEKMMGNDLGMVEEQMRGLDGPESGLLDDQ
jgi:hypothetical protein